MLSKVHDEIRSSSRVTKERSSSSDRLGTQRSLRRIATSRWFLGCSFIALLLVALALGRETYRKYQITQEILEQRQLIELLEQQNRDLGDYVAYLQTDNYRERVARERLGLQRDGEQVVIVPEQTSNVDSDHQDTGEPLSNTQLWWNYFFGVRE